MNTSRTVRRKEVWEEQDIYPPTYMVTQEGLDGDFVLNDTVAICIFGDWVLVRRPDDIFMFHRYKPEEYFNEY